MLNRGILALIAALIGVGLAFAIWPGLDLRTSALFGSAHGFPAEGVALLRIARRAAYWAPYLVFGSALAVLATFGLIHGRRESSVRAALFLGVTLLLGPGLLVNVGLKDHSHRPRPVQVLAFGGTDRFQPWYRFDGGCRRNCSFASGEAAAAFWTAAPALLAPPPFTLPSLAAALVFGVGTSALRLAFGGHFLSDVVLAGLAILLIILVTARLLRVGPGLFERPPASG